MVGSPEASILTTATSRARSLAATVPGNVRPSASVTVIWVAPSTTWAAVRMLPFES